MPFHAKHNVYFERLSDGSVRIYHKEDRFEEPGFDVVLGANTWASVVASVSPSGDSGEAHDWAKRFHTVQMGDIGAVNTHRGE